MSGRQAKRLRRLAQQLATPGIPSVVNPRTNRYPRESRRAIYKRLKRAYSRKEQT